jgi:hypothetical protein
MSQELAPNALGSIKLSYEQPLSDEHLQGVQDLIRQAGLQIQDSRRYTVQLRDRVNHVVEIIANYEDMTLEQWSDLTDSIVQTYCWPAALRYKGYDMRKRM